MGNGESAEGGAIPETALAFDEWASVSSGLSDQESENLTLPPQAPPDEAPSEANASTPSELHTIPAAAPTTGPALGIAGIPPTGASSGAAATAPGTPPVVRRARAPSWEMAKSNSTSTLFIKHSLVNPPLEETLLQVSHVIAGMIAQGDNVSSEARTHIPVFSEKLFPVITRTSESTDSIASNVDMSVHRFMNRLFQATGLSAESAVVTVIYLRRLAGKSGLTVDSSNWRRVLLAVILLTSKVWEDSSIWNVDMCQLFPALSLKNINWLEAELLTQLEFDVSVSATDYATTYFSMHQSATELKRPFNLKPLSKEVARKLEERSLSLASLVKQPKAKLAHAHSADELLFHPSQVPGSIEDISSHHHDNLGQGVPAGTTRVP
jgi:hypothetical protein